MSAHRLSHRLSHRPYNLVLSEKLPPERRDDFRSLSRPETYYEIRGGEVGERAAYRVELTPEEARRIERASNLESISPDRILRHTIDSNVPDQEERAFHNCLDLDSKWNCKPVQATVGVIDSGLSSTVSGLFSVAASRSESGSDPFSDTNPDGHGTMMGGIAVPASARIVVGQANIPGQDSYPESYCAASLNWMVGLGYVDCVSMSFGGYDPLPALKDAIDNARAHDVQTFASAGNDASTSNFYPGFYADACVGALDRTNGGARASYSNYGSFVDLWINGVGMMVYHPDGSLSRIDGGTSGAAAFGAWMFARLLDCTKRKIPKKDLLDAMKEGGGDVSDTALDKIPGKCA